MKRLCSILFFALLSLPQSGRAQQALSREMAAEVTKSVKTVWQYEARNRFKQEVRDEVIASGDLKLPFKFKVFGECPDDGRSLYISMHGGGSVPHAVNDQQWRNQIGLYAPREGVYVAPRAPWNAWNMWFQEGIDELFERLIQAAVAMWEVNPDKVYLLGYSAGGDGVWRMAPRMADRWAAASMMAGHPGEASQVNLRNTPFMIWMGENDAAYDRNKLAVKHGAILDSLQSADREGYIHSTHIIKGKGHWMERIDTLAIPWMAKFRRNPYPQRVVWRQEAVARTAMYWLSAPEEECSHGMTVIAGYRKNVIELERCDYSRLEIWLNDEMVNLDRPIEVRYRGKRIFRGKVPRTAENIRQTLVSRGDFRYIFPAVVRVEIPKN